MTDVDAVTRDAPAPPPGLSREATDFLRAVYSFYGGSRPTSFSDPEDVRARVAEMDATLTKSFQPRIQAGGPVPERTEFELDGVRTYVLRPRTISDSADVPIYVDIHGGGFIYGSGEACVAMVTPGAQRRKMITWAPDYRMPPSHSFPAALDDLIAVYRKALKERDSCDVFVGGASAGGNLAAALLLRAKDEGLPMPAALVLQTPAVDLTESGDTCTTHLGIDYMSRATAQFQLYAGGHDLSDPYLSPLLGDVRGFPPTYLESGTRDLLLSDTVRMHRKLRAAGVYAELHIGEAMPHGGFSGVTLEDLELAAELDRFVNKYHGR